MLSIFARFLPGTLLVCRWIIAVLVLSLGFFLSGIGTMLPAGVIVIGANVMLLSAGVIVYPCIASYCEVRTMAPDWRGWGLVMLTIPAFWYWGLIEPNGSFRSMIFSLVTAAINGRTALLLGRVALRRGCGAPTRGMALLFATLTTWMVLRFIVIVFGAPSPLDLRGANPTTWMTVFGYIVIMSLMSVCVMWLEVNRLKEGRTGNGTLRARNLSEFVKYFRNKLLLLWSAVSVLIVCVVSMLGIGYVNIREAEKSRLIRSAEQVNDAFVEHTILIFGQIDTVLRSVKGFHLRTNSLIETESFLRTLDTDQSNIDGVYLLASDGRELLPYTMAPRGVTATNREMVQFHRATNSDRVFISPVGPGRVPGQYHFQISRRLDNPDGSFNGVVLATVNPVSLSRYYRDLTAGSQSSVSLLGIGDRKLRARIPMPSADRWATPDAVASQFWDAMHTAPSGRFEGSSPLDTIRRLFVYRKVGAFPLVMVTGFSNDDLHRGVRERMKWLVIISLGILTVTVLLALQLTIEARRRDEQDRFMSMLNHELKTPLSILRLALGPQAMSTGVRKHAQRAVEDMNAVIERCLQVDLLRHGRFSDRPELIHLEAMLTGLRDSSRAPERFTLRLTGCSDPVSDPQLLRIILSNLFDNALKYGSTDQEIVIAAGAAGRRGIPGVVVRATNGIGPAGQPDAGRVFGKYYRATGAHSSTGSGLGLYLAANSARLINAELRYLPTATNITFELWIPL